MDFVPASKINLSSADGNITIDGKTIEGYVANMIKIYMEATIHETIDKKMNPDIINKEAPLTLF